jgi:hypothetical protein
VRRSTNTYCWPSPGGLSRCRRHRQVDARDTVFEMAQMANQMKAMQEMHIKMMAAKTPEERTL